jgi:hypothetical protein
VRGGGGGGASGSALKLGRGLRCTGVSKICVDVVAANIDEDHRHHKSKKNVTVDEGQVLKKSEVSGEELKKDFFVRYVIDAEREPSTEDLRFLRHHRARFALDRAAGSSFSDVLPGGLIG